MRFIRKDPGCFPEVIDLPDTDAIAGELGGEIKEAYRHGSERVFYLKDAEKRGLAHNIYIYGQEIYGPTLVAGWDGKGCTGLSDPWKSMRDIFNEGLTETWLMLRQGISRMPRGARDELARIINEKAGETGK